MPAPLSWDQYWQYKVSPADPATLRREGVEQTLNKLCQCRPDAMRVEELGRSFEDRPVSRVLIGTGPIKVMLWSQMHGDEPTHTAVLLDLLALLQSAPENSAAEALLGGITLAMIPMLNPDGAERWQRHNAHGIDVNRDARARVSPEGRMLQAAVDEFQPEFGFNLHNQNPRSAVSGTLQSAAVSLLVPPPDESGRLNEAAKRARLVASSLLGAISDRCPGAISRYRADYMPRAFGESLQQQGVSTLLVEAGRWAGYSEAELVQLHFHGLLAALVAIATGDYQHADADAYEALPLSHSERLFDLLIPRVKIFNGTHPEGFVADVGINREPVHTPDADAHRHGRIVEIGDLSDTAGIDTIEPGLLCAPGGIIFNPKFSVKTLPDRSALEQSLMDGVTTLVGWLDLNDDESLDAFERCATSRNRWPINLAFIGSFESPIVEPTAEQWQRLLHAVGHGVIAVAVDDPPAVFERVLAPMGIPVIPRRMLFVEFDAVVNMSVEALAEQACDSAKFWNLPRFVRIACGAAADLRLAEWSPGDAVHFVDKPRHVIVNGVLAVRDGQPCGESAGQLIRRRHVAVHEGGPHP